MPHITLQHQDQNGRVYDFRRFFKQLHELLNRTAGIPLGHCKSRLLPIHDTLIGNGSEDQEFFHLEIRLLEGRSPDLKKRIGEGSLALLADMLGDDRSGRVQISVELIDMQKNQYFKFPPLT